jgi:battenin
MPFTTDHRNRLGFFLLGLTNNFAYVIMLSAAYDLLKQSETPPSPPVPPSNTTTATSALNQQEQKFCNEHSTSTILLADTIPSLSTKLVYPFLLVGLPVAYKASATALLSAASFLITGLSTTQVLIFTGVACASFSSGLGESTYLSNTPTYGDVALSGWSMGTGGAGLFGAAAYALLRMVISIKLIMIIMLIVPVTMMLAYFVVIEPVDSSYDCSNAGSESAARNERNDTFVTTLSLSMISSDDSQKPLDLEKPRTYGANNVVSDATQQQQQQSARNNLIQEEETFDMRAKIRYLPSLAKYFLPLLLVYFAEYFINQGLFELIYFPEVTFLDHAAQYRWYQVTYQLGVMISRSSLDLVRIKQLWTMSILQAVNAVLFLAHACKLIHIPSFYIVIGIIVYEGLLGGFTYANTFYRMKKELAPRKHEFGVSTVTIADTLGIVMAGAAALPVHNALCKLYE